MATNPNVDFEAFADILPAAKRTKKRTPRAVFELHVVYNDNGSMTGEGTKRDLLEDFRFHVTRPDVRSVDILRNGVSVKNWKRYVGEDEAHRAIRDANGVVAPAHTAEGQYCPCGRSAWRVIAGVPYCMLHNS